MHRKYILQAVTTFTDLLCMGCAAENTEATPLLVKTPGYPVHETLMKKSRSKSSTQRIRSLVRHCALRCKTLNSTLQKLASALKHWQIKAYLANSTVKPHYLTGKPWYTHMEINHKTYGENHEVIYRDISSNLRGKTTNVQTFTAEQTNKSENCPNLPLWTELFLRRDPRGSCADHVNWKPVNLNSSTTSVGTLTAKHSGGWIEIASAYAFYQKNLSNNLFQYWFTDRPRPPAKNNQSPWIYCKLDIFSQQFFCLK